MGSHALNKAANIYKQRMKQVKAEVKDKSAEEEETAGSSSPSPSKPDPPKKSNAKQVTKQEPEPGFLDKG